jgi:hypothetical protein
MKITSKTVREAYHGKDYKYIDSLYGETNSWIMFLRKANYYIHTNFTGHKADELLSIIKDTVQEIELTIIEPSEGLINRPSKPNYKPLTLKRLKEWFKESYNEK